MDNGGNGGGIIVLVVGGNVTLGGSFSANGNNGNNDQSANIGGAGGSGGSIRLICAGTVAVGNGIMVATGGTGNTSIAFH